MDSMKRTNLLLLIVLIGLGGFAFWYFKNKKNTNLSGYDFEFAVKDTSNIGKIFLADRNGKAVTLTRQNKSDWSVNNRYKARFDVLTNLLETIHRVDLKYRLPRNAVTNVVKDIATNAIKVEIYDRQNRLMKSYYVGGTNMDETGTHMMMDNANEPYVMHIPGFNGGLRVRYFTDEMDWRDRMVFTLTPEQIQSVSLEYPLQKIKSFKLQRTSPNDFSVDPLFNLTPRVATQPAKGLVESFLLGFKFLGAEGFENGFVPLDSLRSTVPFAIIKVKPMEGDTQTLILHPIVPRNADGSLILTDGKNISIEKYFGETPSGDVFLIQHLVFQKIFWAYNSFFSLNKTAN